MGPKQVCVRNVVLSVLGIFPRVRRGCITLGWESIQTTPSKILLKSNTQENQADWKPSHDPAQQAPAHAAPYSLSPFSCPSAPYSLSPFFLPFCAILPLPIFPPLSPSDQPLPTLQHPLLSTFTVQRSLLTHISQSQAPPSSYPPSVRFFPSNLPLHQRRMVVISLTPRAGASFSSRIKR